MALGEQYSPDIQDENEYDYLQTYLKPESNSRTNVSGSSRSMEDASNVADMAAMSGNPYAIGASAALKVLSARQKRKQAEQELQAKMKLERIQRQQKAMSNLMNLSQSYTV